MQYWSIKHKKFPVTADFVGIQLSTNLYDTIRVAIAKICHCRPMLNNTNNSLS
ncbi:MAG: hypothetical protein IPF62_14085 [Bacteroidetes bacterium]|nr:hypothetical protein [Bacteroidota bacterium]